MADVAIASVGADGAEDRPQGGPPGDDDLRYAPHYYPIGGFPCCPGRRIWLSRWVFGVFALFTSVACAGTLFGWFNIVGVLVKEGYYGAGCTPGATSCREQTLALNGIYSAAAICSFVSPILLGSIVDWRGPRTAMRVISSIFALGVVLAIVAQGQRIEGLFYPAFNCLGVAASALILPLYNYSNMFPGHEGLALALINGCFDAGSMVMLIMSLLYGAGVPFATILIAYLCGPVAVLLLSSFVLWRHTPFLPMAAVAAGAASTGGSEEAEPGKAAAAHGAVSSTVIAVAPAGSSSRATTATTGAGSAPGSPATTVDGAVVIEDDGTAAAAAAAAKPAPAPTPAALEPRAAFPNADSASAITPLTPNPPTAAGGTSPTTADAALGKAAPVGGMLTAEELQALPVWRQLLTADFLLYAVFFSACMLRYNMFIGTMDAQLNALGQAADAPYTRIFGIVAPLGFFVQFAVGPILDRLGVVASLYCQWVLVVVMSVLNLIPNLDVHVAAFVLFACFRAFHFSNMTAYLAGSFGYRTMGLTVGLVVLIGGLFAMLQSALLSWAFAAPGATADKGVFLQPNALLLALVAVVGVFPVWAQRRRAARAALVAALRSPLVAPAAGGEAASPSAAA